MRTSVLLSVFCVTLLLGVQSSILPENDIEIDLPLLTGQVLGCYLDTPDGQTIDFTDHSDVSKYELVASEKFSCAVKIKNIKKLGSGQWKLRADSENRENAAHTDVTVDNKGQIGRSLPVFEQKIGENVQITVSTIVADMQECKLRTPAGDVISLIPETEYDTYKYEYKPEVLFPCKVQINDLQESDSGEWTLSLKSETDEEQIMQVELRVNQLQTTEQTDIDESQKNENDDIIWLTEIEHETRTNLLIDLTLSNNGHSENCYIVNNNGSTLSFENLNEEGVTVQQVSYFVSCRVTIGPMNENLIGKWTLCGEHTINDKKITRCQQVSIKWKNEQNPLLAWASTTRPLFNHPIHFGGSLSPVVIGTGDLQSCHIVTPNGEDLVVLPESDYPSIRRVVGSSSYCSVAIGPFEEKHLGEWLLYGHYNSWSGPNDVRYPMHFELYNKDNPYEQAYNITTADAANRIVNIGNTINMEVPGSGILNECFIKTSTGQVLSFDSEVINEKVIFINNNNNVCQVSVGPITEDMLGEWQLTGKFSDGGIFTENRQNINIIQEDPENPLEEDGRVEQNLEDRNLNVDLGSNVAVTMTIGTHYSIDNKHESCHVRTPDGLQYKLMEGFNVYGVEILEQTGRIACGLNISVTTENNIGEWVLISREKSASGGSAMAFERRLRFNIFVEESVNAIPSEINIAEGSDMHVRLDNPTELYETCRLIDASNQQRIGYEKDISKKEYCAFSVKNVTQLDSGAWEIQYGNKILYRAAFQVTVNEQQSVDIEDQYWVQGSRVDMYMGPEKAVFCSLRNPQQFTVFVGFGRCHLVVETVGYMHESFWTMTVGLPGRILTDEYRFKVHLQAPDLKPIVNVSVEVDEDSKKVHLSCSIATVEDIRICKFRGPDGRVLLASQGVGEERYHGRGRNQLASLRSEIHAHDCGITISNPLDEDVGIWRCGIATEKKTHYGFLRVQHPWSMNFADDSIMEPTLKADMEIVNGVYGETMTLSCSIAAAIRYCYFRSTSDGNIIHVHEGMSSGEAEYIGAGFDAGECSIKHRNLTGYNDVWTCNVGLQDHTKPEQQAEINVSMPNMVNAWTNYYTHTKIFEVKATTLGQRIEYCRFVRSDGYGFSMDNVPEGYVHEYGSMNTTCSLRKAIPQAEDLQPWSVVVKIINSDSELWVTTDALKSDSGKETRPFTGSQTSNLSFAWVVLFITISLLAIGILITPQQNRNWARERYTTVRNSFRKVPHSNNNMSHINSTPTSTAC